MACGVMAREPAGRRVGGELASSAARTSQKRARDSLEGKTTRGRDGSAAAGEVSVVVHTQGQRRLQERMKAELEAVRDLHRKAVLLCRGGGGAGAAPVAKGGARFSAAGLRRKAPSEAAAAAKRRKTSPTTKSTAEAAHRIIPAKQQLQPPSQRAAVPAPLPERKIEKSKEEVQERRRRMEELAPERKEFRRLVLAMEKAALPDETVYPRELEELGIAPFEYAVTRTRSQALSQDRILVGVAY
ncbi:unnamed protein product [Urochloa decumbens]|uniref:Uncharacterized protein n=1 Tax=Urochloa decumbens TaxID=240449 RepID=A0ABC8WDU2_9POAL